MTASPSQNGGGACCIVGIGASAGGLEALQRFFDNVPAGSDLAYVIVQHLSPAHKSLMADLLSKHTDMSVVQAADDMPVERNRVYLLPPGKQLSIAGSRLRLANKDSSGALSLPIDIFFTALAQDAGPLAVGVVLSGTGSDGTRGLLAIKAAGGFAACQEPETAQFDGMPRSAIAAGPIDAVLPPEDLPGRIVEHARDTATRRPPRQPLPAGRNAAGDPLGRIVASIRAATGVDFSHYKLATLIRRVERRIHAAGLTSLDEYADLLKHDSAEAVALYKEMLIGVTRFFRDPGAFKALAERAVADIVGRAGPHEGIRVWVCGCATGEEAYSLAILFTEAMERQGRIVDVKIFATDIDRDSIEFAGQAEYPATIADDVSAERLARFFVPRGQKYCVARDIRRMLVFAVHNIMRDPPFTKVDLVSCRNLLIYMDSPLQRQVLGLFQYALRPGGALFLGTSETLGDLASNFQTLDGRNKIFRSLRAGSFRLSRMLLPGTTAPARPEDGAHGGPHGAPHGGPHPGEEALAIDEAIGVLLKTYVPPCLLVNEQMNILHVFGDAGPLLRVPTGEATLNVLKLLPTSVAMVAGTALTRAFRSNEELALSAIPVKDRDGIGGVHLRVKPFASRKANRRFALVLLEPTAGVADAIGAEFELSADTAERIRGLEEELLSRGRNLQATVEELETTNEELQATNEELLASNEELQSTNEELQSVNEELYSVNAEYQAKVEELTEITADLDNLLRSTKIGVVFLDHDLIIRRYTPAAASFINIIPRDVGRSITDLSTSIDYPEFLDDLRAVFADGNPHERHVRARDNRWALARILPYLTDKNTQAGIVVTFIDITAAKDAEQRLQTVINSLPEHIAVLDRQGRITMVNEAWRRFARENGDPDLEHCGPGCDYLNACRPRDGGAHTPGDPDARAVHTGLSAILAGELERFTIEYPCHAPNHQRRFLMYAVPIRDVTGGAVVSHIDITSRTEHAARAAPGVAP